MIKGFKRISQKDPELQAVINAMAEFARQLELNPLLDYIILKDVTIGTTATEITHKLGRAWRGWMVTSRTSSVVPYETTQSDTTKFLTLIASSSTTVDLYIF
jgi:hypothetical protein